MLKLKLQYFDHLMQRVDSLEKTLVPGKNEDKRRRGQQRLIHQYNGHELGQTPGDVWVKEAWTATVLGVSNSQTRMGD